MEKAIASELACQPPLTLNEDPHSVLPWWEPERVTLFWKGSWRTLPGWNMTDAAKLGTVGVSPIDSNGKAHFIAWDIDSGKEEDVRAVLEALPEGSRPLVSSSGKKGWHIWIFPDQPLNPEEAVEFAKAVREKAGLDHRACEVFPQSKRSRCLKWPGQKHHETGEVEVFVPVNALRDRDRYDTRLILQALHDDGFWRTSASLILDWLRKHSPVADPLSRRQTEARSSITYRKPSEPKSDFYPFPSSPPVQRPKTILDLLRADERIVEAIHLMAKTPYPGMGMGFRCFLPGHRERRPSASWYRRPSGVIVFHDWHARDGHEWLTFGEVIHALHTKRVQKLAPVEEIDALCRFAAEHGLLEEHVAAAIAAWEKIFSEVVQTTNLYIRRFVVCTDPLLAVVKALFAQFMDAAQQGRLVVVASARFLASRAGLPVEVTNRASNVLALLGVVKKLPPPPGTNDRWATRWVLCAPDRERFQEVWQRIRHIPFRKLNRTRVAELFGEEVANAIFFRRSEGLAYSAVCGEKATFSK